jgi:glycosyltransferase involved in cell wall biosynthesis
VRVAYIVPGESFEARSGSSLHIQRLVQGIDRAGHQIAVFDARNGRRIDPFANAESKSTGSGRTWQLWVKRRIPAWCWTMLGGLEHATREGITILESALWMRSDLSAIRMEAPDIIYQRLSFARTLGRVASNQLGIPLVLEINAPILYERKRYERLHFPRQARLIHDRIMHKAAAVIVVSNALKDYIVQQEGIDENKITVIPNGVDISRFDRKGEVYRERMGIEKREIVVGYIGALKPWHGIDILLGAATTLNDPRIKHLIIGDGPLLSFCEDFVHQHNLDTQVILTGYAELNQIPEYLAAIDIAVAPYPQMDLFYFSPIKLFEYMAAGKAIIASRLGQIAEVLEDGRTGILFTPGNVEELCQHISRLVADRQLRIELGRAAQRESVSHTWRKNVSEVIAVLEKVVHKPSMPSSEPVL